MQELTSEVPVPGHNPERYLPVPQEALQSTHFVTSEISTPLQDPVMYWFAAQEVLHPVQLLQLLIR